MKRVIFAEEAERDLEQASAWFDEHSGIGGSGFVAAIREVVERINEMPLAAPPWIYDPKFRAWTVQRLPTA